MSPTSAVYEAYTGEVNPEGVSPKVTASQLWAGLKYKVDHAHEFVPAIVSTEVLGRGEDKDGRVVTTRDIVFQEGNRRVREEVVLFPPTKVIFYLRDGSDSKVQNIISTGKSGNLLLTYDFDWMHKGMSEEDLAVQKEKYTKMSQMAVESTISVTREMVKKGLLGA